MERQNVYCEIEFYNQFIDSFPSQIKPTDDGIKKSKRWIDFHNFILKSDLVLNVNGSDFKTLTESNELYWTLWKRSTSGQCGLEFNDVCFPDLHKFEDCVKQNKTYLSSVFLTCSPNELCKNIETSYGVKIIPIEDVFMDDSFFDLHIESIEKGIKSHINWDFLGGFQHPCNSLAIVDNFILNKDVYIFENLFPILDKLLPASLNIPFHISIFAKCDFNNKEHQEKIRNFIKSNRPKLEFKLTVHKMQDEFHDRSIITNYMLIDSGGGFDLFSKKRATKQTRVICYYPHSSANLNFKAHLDYHTIKSSLKKIFDSSCATEFLTTYWGDKENRLFEN
jgi:hypothetical protein